MQYIEQPKGLGTAYRFRMKTPKSLQGTPVPWAEGKFFGTWIIKAMGGEKHLPTAKKLRDVFLAEVRKLELERRARLRFSVERAELWADALRGEDLTGDIDDHDVSIRDLIYDEAQAAPKGQQQAFRKVALARTLSVSSAVQQYLYDRRPGNGHNYKPLGQTSINELGTAVNYLCAFNELTPETLFLDDVTPEMVLNFRGEYLPTQTSKKTKVGLSQSTIEKLTTMLRGVWRWAMSHRKVKLDGNPFDLPVGVPRAMKSNEQKRDMFVSKEVQKLLAALPQGDRMGDLFRVGLASGARITEIAKVKVQDAAEDGSVYFITGGKTENAKRVVPVPSIARPIVARLRADAIEGKHDRLFHKFPLNASTGTAKSASKAFTDQRRKILGLETDGRLSFHSLRHTWKTLSRRAGLSIDDAHDLGGWAGDKRSSDPYDHGLNISELTTAQEKVSELMEREGYLDGF